MKKTFKGLVVCTMLSSAFIPTATFAGNDSLCDALCSKKLASNDLYDVNCEYSSIQQPAREECVPVYTEEERQIQQPDKITYVPRQVTSTRTQCQPPIVEKIPVKKTRTVHIKQPDAKVLVPVITYKEVCVPQPDKIAFEDYVVMEEKITPRKPLTVTDTHWVFEKKVEKQHPKSVKLQHHKVERVTNNQPAMDICAPSVNVKAPANGNCEKPAYEAPACACIIKNDTKAVQTLTFYYYESTFSFSKKTMKLTIKPGQSHTLELGSHWHSKKIVLKNESMRVSKGSEILLSKLS